MQRTNPVEDPRDLILINLLCPAQDYRGVCRQRVCGQQGYMNGGTCTLNGKPFGSFCVIPQSHPVSEFQREMARADAQARAAATLN